ncbi:MucR family transcriptional regulator [Mesorhizobium sp. CC13]|uniref:MucR family transcriptional regulator n=1 Tax=Mesorhizobium sp. CC13 TaxID=3029194 RepID=UPI0032651103
MIRILSTHRTVANSPVEFTAKIASAYVCNNSVALRDIGELIGIVHRSFIDVTSLKEKSSTSRFLQPAVPIKNSVTGDYIICLEDGRKFKSIRNHIEKNYKLSPEEYRAKWRLPSDYPMVAPNYSALRSRIAKELGLGRKAEALLERARNAASNI